MKNNGQPTLVRRFWAKVDLRGADECWPWIGHIARNGYGQIARGPRHADGLVLAHRQSYIFANGQIADGMLVCHRCDNRRCVNPDHLFLGTNADNNRDAAAKGRSPSGTRNAGAKLSPADVSLIRARYSFGGASQRALAAEFGVSQIQVSRIVSFKNWAVAS